MVKLVKGFAGCGKTTKLLEDAYNLVNSGAVSSDKILVLTLTLTEKNELELQNRKLANSKNITIWSFDNLLNYLLKKSPTNLESKTISDFLAINLIDSICKKEFANVPPNSSVKKSKLMNLTKSNTFFRELYNLFSLFKNNEITYEDLQKILRIDNISVAEKSRLEKIFNAFNEYNKILKANNLLDYRDIVVEDIKALSTNKILLETIKSKFSHIFIDGLEDITYLQFKLVKLICNPENLYLYGDEYSRIQEFRGAWRDSMILDTLKSNFKKLEVLEFSESKRNDEILERALYLIKKYNSEKISVDFKMTQSIKYKLFEDIQAEIVDIASDISNKVQNENCEFKDCAILIRDYEAKQKIIDLFKAQGIPINSEHYNQDYQNFKTKLTRYLGICEVLEKLGINSFNKSGVAKVVLSSRAEKEILFEELNLYLENVLSEILDDIYTKERLIPLKEESKNISLVDVVYKNIDLLKEADKQKLLEEFSRISEVYELFKCNNFVELFLFVAKSQRETFKNSEFNSIFSKLFTKICEISDLYRNVLNEKLELNTVRDIINIPFEDNLNLSNSLNLLTFFKTAGLEFKHVYIPSLSEKVFPRQVKSTYFISHETNETVSEEIRKINPNFRHLIELDKDSIEEEARLFYLGMTRAKESLTISTHKWKDKKQVQPSMFYQTLVDIDRDNYEEIDGEKNKTEKFEISENSNGNTVSLEKSAVLEEDNVLKLNTSAISNFLSCPKKYYCKNLLNLKEESIFSASYGTIVHAILEIFMKKHLDKYNKAKILELGDILFEAKNTQQKAIEEGFKQTDIDKIIATDDLNLAEMKENFIDAVEQLELNGFFEKIPSEVLTEKNFNFSIDELQNVEFDGRIDAFCKFNDGYKIIDYKTGKNKEYNLTNMLNFKTSSGRDPQNMETYLQKYDYQILLYYFATKNAETLADFKDKISELGLLYVRPKSKEDGYKEDFAEVEKVEESSAKIIQNLKTTVIDKILEKDTFEPQKNYMNCENCAYNFLCDEDEENDDDN